MSGISPMTVARTSSMSTCGTCGRRSTGRSARIRWKRCGAPDTACGGIPPMRLPIRLRLTIVFTLTMAVLLTVTGGFLYFRLGAEMLRTVDTALLSQADAVAAGDGQQSAGFGAPDPATTRDLGSFAQLLGPPGAILETSATVAGSPAVPAAMLSHIHGPTYIDRVVHGVNGTARILVVPREGGWVVTGTSLQNRDDMLSQLLVLMLVGGPVTLAIASVAGWAVAGAALRPVDRLSPEAAAISVSEPGRRLPIPAGRGRKAA